MGMSAPDQRYCPNLLGVSAVPYLVGVDGASGQSNTSPSASSSAVPWVFVPCVSHSCVRAQARLSESDRKLKFVPWSLHSPSPPVFGVPFIYPFDHVKGVYNFVVCVLF